MKEQLIAESSSLMSRDAVLLTVQPPLLGSYVLHLRALLGWTLGQRAFFIAVSQLILTHPQVLAYTETFLQEAFPDSPGIASLHCPQPLVPVQLVSSGLAQGWL